MTSTDRFPVPVRSAVKSNLTSGVVANIYLAERMASAEREPITVVWGQ